MLSPKPLTLDCTYTHFDVALSNKSSHVSDAYVARFSVTFLRFGSVVDRHAGVFFTCELTEELLYTPAL